MVTVTETGVRGVLGAPPKAGGYLEFVDGIRTIAVLSVLLFHANRDWLPGGFVGVDIFFVISGFLITRICLTDKFSFASFYLSRARRILPAYYAALIVTAGISLVLLLPGDLISSSKSLFAGSLLLQNIVFWKQVGYFSPILERNPYLHTWSLAVEWQFYIIFPFVVRAVRHNSRLLLATLGLLFVATLVASSIGALYKPTPTFYLMPFRVWEFLVGSFAALIPAATPIIRRHGGMLSLAGVAFIAISVALFKETTIFPGASALLPCLATGALLIGGIGNSRSLVAQALAWTPVRKVGQASYSIYLVHWPVFVFTRYFLVEREAPGYTVFLLVLSFALGFAFWRFVEQPFRAPGALGASKRWAMSAAAVTATAGIAGVVLLSGGLPSRFSPEVLKTAAVSEDNGIFRDCLGNGAPSTLSLSKCKFGSKAEGVTPVVVLWGDSLSAALADGMDVVAKERGLTGALFGTDSCPPLEGLKGGFRSSIKLCTELQRSVPKLLASDPVDVLIVHATWKSHRQRDIAAFDAAVRDTFPKYKKLARRVVIVGAPPGARMGVPDAMARASAFRQDVDLRPQSSDREQTILANSIVAKYAAKNGYAFVDLDAYLCQNECKPYIGARPIYFDIGHITATTSRLVARKFADILVPTN